MLQFADVADSLVSFKIPEELTLRAARRRAEVRAGWRLEQDLIRKMPGVLSTRVGYSGGDVLHATYRNHGTHAEAIEIVFDPNIISYRTLLEFFFQIHDPDFAQPPGQRYGHELPFRNLLHERRTEEGC